MRTFMPLDIKGKLKSSERAWARRQYARTVLRKMSRIENIRYERYLHRDLQGYGACRSWLGCINVVEWNR